MRSSQACRRHIYADETQDSSIEDRVVAVNQDPVWKTGTFLVGLVSSRMNIVDKSDSRKREILEEIELFMKCLMEEDE